MTVEAMGAPETAPSGYVLEHFFFQRQFAELVDPTTIDKDAPASAFRMSWDWAWDSKDGFTVSLTLALLESQLRPERIELTLVARFHQEGESGPLTIDNFARYSAPAMMFPYLRQQVTSLTWAGPIGPLVLPPMNIIQMMEGMDPNDTTAAKSPRPE